MNQATPKVSVVCTCFNHGAYVTESMESVLNQTYRNYELIVVDDGSSDNSVTVIQNYILKHPEITFINLQKNAGICKAFNTAFKICQGDFIIDLAADDILLPDRLEKGVESFQRLDDRYGVIFSDAEWIDGQGNHLHFHSEKYPYDTIPKGDVYRNLIERYFICSPTMMFRRSVIEKLAGYDEMLTYEDFDFWIRSSRIYFYDYDPAVLVRKRRLKHSLSHNQFKLFNKHNYSTYRVCQKILKLNRTPAEYKALHNRILYEIRQCIRTLDFSLAFKYSLLLGEVRRETTHTKSDG